MGCLEGDALGPDGHQVGAAPELPEDGQQLHGPTRQVLHQGLGVEAGEEGQRHRVGSVVDGSGGGAEPLDVGQITEDLPAQVGGAGPVQATGLPRGQDGPAGLPNGGDHLRIEIAEGAGHHFGLHVAEHPTPSQDVEGEGVEAHCLPHLHRLVDEVVGPSEIADVRADGGHELVSGHRCSVGARPDARPVPGCPAAHTR